MRRMILGTIFLLSAAPTAMARPDDDAIRRYCAGMDQQIRLPDRTRADCLSATHAIEVEFTERWAEALGQALHYALWTQEIAKRPADFPKWGRSPRPLRAGIILVCHRRQELCTDHAVRLYRIIEEYRLPVTVWDCDLHRDMTLGACQRIDK